MTDSLLPTGWRPREAEREFGRTLAPDQMVWGAGLRPREAAGLGAVSMEIPCFLAMFVHNCLHLLQTKDLSSCTLSVYIHCEVPVVVLQA